VAGNKNHIDYVGRNWRDLCTAVGDPYVRIEQNTNNPIVGADAFLRAFERIRATPNVSVLLDITTFTREALLVLVGLLREVIGSGGRITCVYNSAKSYGTVLSRGIREIRSILGFPGDIRASRRNHMIVVFGYEVERAASLIATYEPNVLSIGVPTREASLSPEMFEPQQLFVKQLRATYPIDQIQMFDVSARDPLVTRDAILTEIQKYPNLNTVLAPFNTKLAVVGSCLAAFAYPAAQMCYAQPNAYNIVNYAVPSDDVYVFELTASLPTTEHLLDSLGATAQENLVPA
jgi:hypothetical protein